MNNIYYSPEKFGLTMVGEIEWSSGSYEFDTTAVWRNAGGQLLYAEDSGCSCPSPFEAHAVDTLISCTPAELQAHLEGRNEDNYGDRSAEIADLMARIVA